MTGGPARRARTHGCERPSAGWTAPALQHARTREGTTLRPRRAWPSTSEVLGVFSILLPGKASGGPHHPGPLLPTPPPSLTGRRGRYPFGVLWAGGSPLPVREGGRGRERGRGEGSGGGALFAIFPPWPPSGRAPG